MTPLSPLRVKIPLPYENSFKKYKNPYSHEKFIEICKEYGVNDEDSDENKVSDEESCDVTKWRNQKYFAT